MRPLPHLLAASLALLPAFSSAAEVPAPDKILATLVHEHPRLFASKADFQNLRDQLARDAELARWFAQVRKDADRALAQPPSDYVIPDGKRLLATSRRVKQRVQALGLVFLLTGDQRYADRLWREVDAAAHFKDWNPRHFLDTAEMTNAFALAYDWLYDVWTPEQRAELAASIKNMGLNQALPLYRKKTSWVTRHNNWNQVCNGGMTMGALAIADEEPALAGEIIHDAVESLPLAMNQFAPDGAWGEGPGYWHYATEYNVYALAAMRTALGTDFDLSKAPGFSKTAEFPAYFVGPTGKAFNFADASSSFSSAPQNFWLARAFDTPGAAALEIPYAEKKASPLDVLWGAWWLPRHPKPSDLPLARHFRGSEIVSLRSAWDDPRALFIGFKGGDNKTSHSHLDLGSFVFDALGKRWACDLGPDDYNLPGYFGKLRWTYYRLRAEGHNTLVINPGEAPDQDPKAAAAITRFSAANGHSFAIADLSAAYARDARRVERGIALLDGRRALVEDEIETPNPSEVWWFLHTPAAIATNGATASLTLGGERLTAQILEPAGAVFEALPAEPLPTSPHPPKQGVHKPSEENVHKLAVHLTGVTNTRLVVLLTPGGDEKPEPAPEIQPLAAWK